MKSFLLLLFLIFSFWPAYSQLQIDEKSKVNIAHSEISLTDFINTNKFDYAIIAWYNLSRVTITDEIYCLFQQQNNWYLAKLSRTLQPPLPPFFVINQCILTQLEADSITLKLNAAAAFQNKQEDFDKLPQFCQYEKDGKITGLIDVQDAATYHLLQLSNKEIRSLYFYAPDNYLKRCYPYVKEFGILKGFVNTVTQLSNQTKNLKN